uniref:Uncharacterized protein n=1 Tax=Globodera pallida TaxID=36090 RepID=A0A183C486_GLOPA
MRRARGDVRMGVTGKISLESKDAKKSSASSDSAPSPSPSLPEVLFPPLPFPSADFVQHFSSSIYDHSKTDGPFGSYQQQHPFIGGGGHGTTTTTATEVGTFEGTDGTSRLSNSALNTVDSLHSRTFFSSRAELPPTMGVGGKLESLIRGQLRLANCVSGTFSSS